MAKRNPPKPRLLERRVTGWRPYLPYADWVKLLGEDKRAIFTAASKATEAAQYLERLGGMAPVEEAEMEAA